MDDYLVVPFVRELTKEILCSVGIPLQTIPKVTGSLYGFVLFRREQSGILLPCVIYPGTQGETIEHVAQSIQLGQHRLGRNLPLQLESDVWYATVVLEKRALFGMVRPLNKKDQRCLESSLFPN